MTLKSLLLSTVIAAGTVISCSEAPTETASEENKNASKEMNTYLSMFEIPVTDLSRAIQFYEAVMGLKIEKMEMEGMEMGILPYENQSITAVLMKAEGYRPSADGITVYLNAGDNLQPMLDRVEPNGGKIIIPKTAHADESGYFAIFLDSEGNKLGLNSPH